METPQIKEQVRLSSFVVSKMDDGTIVFSTISTEQNNGGMVLGIYNLVSDLKTYPFIEQQFNMAYAGDEPSKVALHLRCSALYAIKCETLIDHFFVLETCTGIEKMRERIRKALDAQDVKEPELTTDEEWMQEQETLEKAKAAEQAASDNDK